MIEQTEFPPLPEPPAGFNAWERSPYHGEDGAWRYDGCEDEVRSLVITRHCWAHNPAETTFVVAIAIGGGWDERDCPKWADVLALIADADEEEIANALFELATVPADHNAKG